MTKIQRLWRNYVTTFPYRMARKYLVRVFTKDKDFRSVWVSSIALHLKNTTSITLEDANKTAERLMDLLFRN